MGCIMDLAVFPQLVVWFPWLGDVRCWCVEEWGRGERMKFDISKRKKKSDGVVWKRECDGELDGEKSVMWNRDIGSSDLLLLYDTSE